jgi:putative transcriptional regulator
MIMDDKAFDTLLASTKEAREILDKKRTPSRRFYIEDPNAKEIRERFHLTQDEFAKLLNISVGTLRNWEQGRRKPEGPARVLLNVANMHPEALLAL